VTRSDELVKALVNAQVGGFLAQPPGLDGTPGLGIAGITGIPRGRTWDVTSSAHAPALVGDTVTFVTLEDGTIVVNEEEPDDSLAPLAEAVEQTLSPPYRAAAVRKNGDIWSVVAEKVAIVELPEISGDVVDLTVVDGERELRIDGDRTIRPLPALDALCDEHADVALHAERVDAAIFAVDVFPL
jgi:hypothetical protein